MGCNSSKQAAPVEQEGPRRTTYVPGGRKNTNPAAQAAWAQSKYHAMGDEYGDPGGPGGRIGMDGPGGGHRVMMSTPSWSGMGALGGLGGGGGGG